MRTKIALALIVIVGMLDLVMPAALRVSGSEAATTGKGAPYYLALGDSLAAGHQPRQGLPNEGYARDIRKTFAERLGGLRLHNVACVGETSRSLITGQHSACRYAAGSQLGAALAFITRHPGEIAFATVDVGTDDLFTHCLSRRGVFARACVVDVMPRVERRLSRIFDKLRSALGPDVPIASMTYFDPLLGLWLVPGGKPLARISLRAMKAANRGFRSAYAAGGILTADAAATFQIVDFDHSVAVPGLGRIPVNVANTCRWTWFCSSRFFGDPHPKRSGYHKIAHAFNRKLVHHLP
jgi:hypothetical protein